MIALAGTAAHELNQPLTSVLGYAELLKRKLREDDYAWAKVDIIHKEAERMKEIVRKIGRDHPLRDQGLRRGSAHPRSRIGLGRGRRSGLQGIARRRPHLAPLELSRSPKIWRVCAYFPTSVS